MKRIKLKAEIISAPLSSTEMRNIVGGTESYSCKCDIYDADNNPIMYSDAMGSTSGIQSPSVCDSVCSGICDLVSGAAYLATFKYTKEGN